MTVSRILATTAAAFSMAGAVSLALAQTSTAPGQSATDPKLNPRSQPATTPSMPAQATPPGQSALDPKANKRADPMPSSTAATKPATTGAGAMSAKLSGSNEVPAVTTAGNGTVLASLDKNTNVLSWTVTYTGLSGPATGAHFHGPAGKSENAGVAVPINGSLDSPIKGTATLTPAQASDFAAGKYYVNVHTAKNPNGEIRGQVGAMVGPTGL